MPKGIFWELKKSLLNSQFGKNIWIIPKEMNRLVLGSLFPGKTSIVVLFTHLCPVAACCPDRANEFFNRFFCYSNRLRRLFGESRQGSVLGRAGRLIKLQRERRGGRCRITPATAKHVIAHFKHWFCLLSQVRAADMNGNFLCIVVIVTTTTDETWRWEGCADGMCFIPGYAVFWREFNPFDHCLQPMWWFL